MALRLDAQVFTVQHTFTNSPDGSHPGSLVLDNGTVFGTASSGGTSNVGVIFKFNLDNTGFTNLFNFTGGANGAAPNDLLVDNGSIYGTTSSGGTNNYGLIYRLNTNGSGFTVLYRFNVTPDARAPKGSLLLAGGMLYGVSQLGGSKINGAIYQISTNGTGYSVLHSFTNAIDGSAPQGGLVLVGNSLYGTTTQGGTGGWGTLFKINTNGSGFTLLHAFTNTPDAGTPSAKLMAIGNTLYGSGSTGGTNISGGIFKINTDGTGYSLLYSFTNSPAGAAPKAQLLLNAGTFYGTTFSGGSNTTYGTIFRINTNGTGYTTLKSFSNTPPDGGNPQTPLILNSNALWGTTWVGGNASGGSGGGIAFSLQFPNPVISWSFTNLVLATGTNCDAVMPDVTGTNFILASSSSGPVTITQSPTNNALLPVGTNLVIVAVTDVFTNTVYSTNRIVVQDQAPPIISLNGSNPFYVEIFHAFADPGATAAKSCGGSVPVTVSGTVITNVLGTNILTYTAVDIYGNTNTATRTVIVRNTTPPTITPVGANPFYVEYGSPFIDPGATATNFFGVPVSVTTTGTVNTNSLGTNTITYTAVDTYGNTNTFSRTVVVRDTTPPVIAWSFTNLVLAATTNANAVLPNLTGTNYILASDSAGPVTITQNPTNNAVLPLGTNIIILTVTDSSGNQVFSTNTVVVKNETPPTITPSGANPFYVEFGSPFNDPGATATDAFGVPVAVITTGMVNTNALGTNIVTYIAVDTYGNTNTFSRTVVVRITSPPTINSIKLNLDGSISLELTNTPGSSVHVWTSTNLLLPMVSWQLISSNVVGTNGVWEFLDTNNMQERARFYRASAP